MNLIVSAHKRSWRRELRQNLAPISAVVVGLTHSIQSVIESGPPLLLTESLADGHGLAFSDTGSRSGLVRLSYSAVDVNWFYNRFPPRRCSIPEDTELMKKSVDVTIERFLIPLRIEFLNIMAAPQLELLRNEVWLQQWNSRPGSKELDQDASESAKKTLPRRIPRVSQMFLRPFCSAPDWFFEWTSQTSLQVSDEVGMTLVDW